LPQNTSSYFELFKGKWLFAGNEKTWFKLVIYILTIFFFLALAIILKEWVLPAMFGNKLHSTITEIKKFFN
jgi:hypothetical protein